MSASWGEFVKRKSIDPWWAVHDNNEILKRILCFFVLQKCADCMNQAERGNKELYHCKPHITFCIIDPWDSNPNNDRGQPADGTNVFFHNLLLLVHENLTMGSPRKGLSTQKGRWPNLSQKNSRWDIQILLFQLLLPIQWMLSHRHLIVIYTRIPRFCRHNYIDNPKYKQEGRW